VSLLTDPLDLPCGRTLSNRLAKAAMSERLGTTEHGPSEGLERLYRRWAAGGAGLLITGNVMVDPRHLGESGNVALEDGRHLDALRGWAAAARSGGAEVWMQLNHPGRQAPRTLDPEPVAPSAVAMRGTYGTFATPRSMADREIRDVVDRFGAAAALAIEAGFSGVQIHAAHGYLISQFLSPHTNHREDRWGGSADRRMRLLLEVCRAVRGAVGGEAPVSVKLNSADFQRGGFSEAESMAVVEALCAERVDLIEISGGTYERAAMFAEKPSTAAREAFFLDYAEKVRARVGLPLMLTGGFRTAAAMQGAVAEGVVDVVGLARPLAVEPDLPRRLLDGSATGATAVRIHTGIAPIDSVLTGSWYQVQLERMSRGLDPDPRSGRWSALTGYLRDAWRGHRTRRALGA
jgi:2,4-dienoyl-CoA reductase-like NADH-dependent reductase (Old Yellow Enzyme family)